MRPSIHLTSVGVRGSGLSSAGVLSRQIWTPLFCSPQSMYFGPPGPYISEIYGPQLKDVDCHTSSYCDLRGRIKGTARTLYPVYVERAQYGQKAR